MDNKRIKWFRIVLGENLLYIAVGAVVWYILSLLGLFEQSKANLFLVMLGMVVMGNCYTRVAIEQEFDELKNKENNG